MALTWKQERKENIEFITSSGGVYLFVDRNGIKGYDVVYVGQSNDIKRRVKEHLSTEESNYGLKKWLNNSEFSIYYAEANSEYLDGLETFLCDYYDPYFNEKNPPGDRIIRCNLPF